MKKNLRKYQSQNQKKQPQNMAKRITRITRKPQKNIGVADTEGKKQKQSKKAPKTPEFVATDLGESDNED